MFFIRILYIYGKLFLTIFFNENQDSYFRMTLTQRYKYIESTINFFVPKGENTAVA